MTFFPLPPSVSPPSNTLPRPRRHQYPKWNGFDFCKRNSELRRLGNGRLQLVYTCYWLVTSALNSSNSVGSSIYTTNWSYNLSTCSFHVHPSYGRNASLTTLPEHEPRNPTWGENVTRFIPSDTTKGKPPALSREMTEGYACLQGYAFRLRSPPVTVQRKLAPDRGTPRPRTSRPPRPWNHL